MIDWLSGYKQLPTACLIDWSIQTLPVAFSRSYTLLPLVFGVQLVIYWLYIWRITKTLDNIHFYIWSLSWILSQVERYAFNIVENGTRVNEEVEVDVEEQTEVFRVPKHNNVDALELLNDFNSVCFHSLSIYDFKSCSVKFRLFHDSSISWKPLIVLFFIYLQIGDLQH